MREFVILVLELDKLFSAAVVYDYLETFQVFPLSHIVEYECTGTLAFDQYTVVLLLLSVRTILLVEGELDFVGLILTDNVDNLILGR